jgi:hypothetical protein
MSSNDMPFKVGIHRRREGIVEFRYGNTFERQEGGERPRILIAPADRQIELMLNLAREMASPYLVLYVLLAPHTEAKPGRYALADLGPVELRRLLEEFQTYFEGDARHHVWIASQTDESLLAYDQHNVIYAYGPLDRFADALLDAGLKEGPTEFPYPHTHHFRDAMNRQEARLMSEFDWIWSPLLPEDEL